MDEKWFRIERIDSLTPKASAGFVGLALQVYGADTSDEKRRIPTIGEWPANEKAVNALVSYLARLPEDSALKQRPAVEIEFDDDSGGRFVRFWIPTDLLDDG